MADVLVLCYHAVSPTWDVDLSVTPDALERQLRHLIRSGWKIVTFTQAVLNPPARRTLALTFDDAFASVNTFAAPLLDQLGLRATVFVPTTYVSDRRPLAWPGVDHWLPTPHSHELAAMSWEELGVLSQAGWEIGSHTCSHPHLTRLCGEQLDAELERSREECRRQLGLPCAAIAYPYGDVDQRVAQRAAAAGYTTGAALSSRLEALGPHRWPRTGVYHEEAWWRFRLKLMRPMRELRATKLWIRRG